MIELHDLTRIYDAPADAAQQAPVVAADHLTLTIPAREVFGLIGPNGAGKTTTLKMICGLLEPSAGRVTVNGVDVQTDPEEAHRHLGYLADFFSVYDDLTVWEYLDYFARAYKLDTREIPKRIDRVIEDLGLTPKRSAFVAGLSRGMKQRLGIARALIHDPPVLVLDEPTVGLDPNARVEFKAMLKALHAGGKTILITSHLLADLEELCTSIGVIEQGRLLQVGPLAEIMRAAAGTRTVRIRLASAGFPLASWLRRRPEVIVTDWDAQTAQCALSGGDVELASLVTALVQAGASVCAVEEVSQTLEQAFSRLSRGGVS